MAVAVSMKAQRALRAASLVAHSLVERGPRAMWSVVRGMHDYWREPIVMQSMPVFLQIEPTILCNLECSYCINPFLPRERTSLTLDKFTRILDEVPSTRKISLVGIGETFMNKEVFSIIRYAKSRGIEVATTSNGTILTDRILGEILDSGLDALNFSLDGATKATYEKLRPGATFEKVLANIRRIAAAVEGRPRPKLAIWFLLNRDNVFELPDMVELVRSLGISSLNTQGVHYWGHPDWHDRANQANALDDLTATLQETRRRAEAAGIDFQWHNFPDAGAARECKWPWKGAYVTADGFVTPCCENGSDPVRINFGNVFEQPFVQIWNSEAYQQFRRELKSPAGRPAICADCPSYHKVITVPDAR
jgi:radical SAM protein with 4Fe4S-binding SPASM domain